MSKNLIYLFLILVSCNSKPTEKHDAISSSQSQNIEVEKPYIEDSGFIDLDKLFINDNLKYTDKNLSESKIFDNIGMPDSIKIDTVNYNIKTFYYGKSYLEFLDHRIVGFHFVDKNLRFTDYFWVGMPIKQLKAKYPQLYSSREDDGFHVVKTGWDVLYVIDKDWSQRILVFFDHEKVREISVSFYED
ncbi:MAG: hypothetical protein C4K58_01195 [Flavobacteriaceae bacterium]|nr:MAG: hypothetical protein C4K58_01195 [Flavobacteriaceae bacterium]